MRNCHARPVLETGHASRPTTVITKNVCARGAREVKASKMPIGASYWLEGKTRALRLILRKAVKL